jgi:hypothetical protein
MEEKGVPEVRRARTLRELKNPSSYPNARGVSVSELESLVLSVDVTVLVLPSYSVSRLREASKGDEPDARREGAASESIPCLRSVFTNTPGL